MTGWQPDWNTLETTAASLIASDPLAALIATVTPVGGYVSIALRAALADVVSAATKAVPLSGALVIAVDTLEIAAGDTVIAAPGVDIKARAVVIDGGPATVIIRSDTPGAGIQLTTAGISGTLNVAFQKADGSAIAGPGNGPLAMSSLVYPQVITATAASAASPSTAAVDVADSLHEPWAIVALEVSAAIAATLVDQGSDGALELAADMLGWVTGGCTALIACKAQFPTVDFGNLASLQTTAVGLLSFTQAQTSGATYVPVLSADRYQQQIDSLLGLAQTYDAKITAFQDQQNIDQLLALFAKTLSDTYQEAETPLLNALQRLAAQSGAVQGQLTNAAVQLKEVSATLPSLQQALEEAIKDEFQQELVKAAVDTLATVLELYVAVGAILLFEDPNAVITEAMYIVQELIQLGEEGIDEAIKKDAESAANPPTAPQDFDDTKTGAQYLAGSLASFGKAVALLWTAVSRAASSQPPNLSPDLVSAVDQLPDLSGFSIGGLDPVTYWQAVVVQTTAAVQPHNNLPQATAYLEAVQLAATYGSAVGDLQMKLLELYTQGMTAFDQLVAAYRAQTNWTKLQNSLTNQADQVAAAIGLLQRGYLNIKRSLVLAVENYRAAFLYQWLQPASIQIDVSMDLVALQQAATNSITGLNQVLAGTPTGLRPPQNFQAVQYQVAQPLFTEVNGQPQVQFTIDPTVLAQQLNGNTALFLSAATFEFEGGTQSEKVEVELQIATSGHYTNQLSENRFRFVSQPVSMTNDYYPGTPPRWVTKWQFADPTLYLAPTPYTNWTLTVYQGQTQGVTAIKLTLAGAMLQNPIFVA
jgi:hypothetical protein